MPLKRLLEEALIDPKNSKDKIEEALLIINKAISGMKPKVIGGSSTI